MLHNSRMVIFSQNKLGLRAITLAVWALAAGSAMYWGLRLTSSPGVVAPLSAGTTAVTALDPLVVARFLGATAPKAVQQASISSRFALQGVVAGSPGGGAALIAVDGQPARSFRVGTVIEEGLVLQSATARQVNLSETLDGPVVATLDMPLLDKQ